MHPWAFFNRLFQNIIFQIFKYLIDLKLLDILAHTHTHTADVCHLVPFFLSTGAPGD